MRRAKYIVRVLGGIEAAVVFSATMGHAEVAQVVGGTILGAGFCEFYSPSTGGETFGTEDIRIQTYGRSNSLNLAPRGEDAALIEKDILG